MGSAYVAAVGLVLTAIVTAVIGPIVTTIVLRRRQPTDLDVIHALASALADETEKRRNCEARELARRERPCATCQYPFSISW